MAVEQEYNIYVEIVLYKPEIAGNVGSCIRLSANTGLPLNLIKPFGFNFQENKIRRAGLDYHQYTQVQLYKTLDDYLDKHPTKKLVGFSTKGSREYTSFQFKNQDS